MHVPLCREKPARSLSRTGRRAVEEEGTEGAALLDADTQGDVPGAPRGAAHLLGAAGVDFLTDADKGGGDIQALHHENVNGVRDLNTIQEANFGLPSGLLFIIFVVFFRKCQKNSLMLFSIKLMWMKMMYVRLL